MSEIHWVKLSTQMFDDEKIKVIETMPSGGDICLIWVKLIVLAGRTNDNGAVYLTKHLPYTPDMLARIFSKPVETVRMALDTFVKLEMIEIDKERVIVLVNWELHQNIDGMERIRKLTAERVKRLREKRKLLTCNVTGSATEAPGNAIDLDLEIDTKRIVESTLRRCPTSENVVKVIDYLNFKTGRKFSATTKATQRMVYARINEGHHFVDFQRVIDAKVKQWSVDPKMAEYLRPETLFGTKFDSYLAATEPLKVKADESKTAANQFDLDEYERTGKLVKVKEAACSS